MDYIKPNKWLFNKIIRNTPLVSIDLIIRNSKGDFLLNLRGRFPAYRTWFFFGGSIKKPEKPKDAFIRILEREFFSILKVDFEASKFTKLAVHQYKENLNKYVNRIEEGIQYYVLCYELKAELSDTEIQSILLAYKEAVNKKIINKIKSMFGFKVEPEALNMRWFSEEEIKSSSEVHNHVKHYFKNDPNTISSVSMNVPPNSRAQSLTEPPPPPPLNSLLTLYQTQSKSINSYTTVIWTFPIVFVIALGNIFKNYNQSDLVLILSVFFAFLLLHAFKKHTYIHEALKESLDKVERSIKQESAYISEIMPDWSFVKTLLKSHLLVRRFLVFFTYSYTFFCLLTIISHYLQVRSGFFSIIFKYIINPLCSSNHIF